MKSKFDDQCYATIFLREKTTFIEEVCVTVEAASVEDLSEIIYRNLFRQKFIAVKNFTDKRLDDG